MPIQSFATFTKWVARENISVPQHFYDALLPVKDDDAQVREVGTKLVGEMCRKILAAPEKISGLHIYTLNLQVGARMLLEEVGLEADVEKVSPLPWTPVSRVFFFPLVWGQERCGWKEGSEEGGRKASVCMGGERKGTETTKLNSFLFSSQSLTPNRRTESIRPIVRSFLEPSPSPSPSLSLPLLISSHSCSPSLLSALNSSGPTDKSPTSRGVSRRVFLLSLCLSAC